MKQKMIPLLLTSLLLTGCGKPATVSEFTEPINSSATVEEIKESSLMTNLQNPTTLGEFLGPEISSLNDEDIQEISIITSIGDIRYNLGHHNTYYHFQSSKGKLAFFHDLLNEPIIENPSQASDCDTTGIRIILNNGTKYYLSHYYQTLTYENKHIGCCIPDYGTYDYDYISYQFLRISPESELYVNNELVGYVDTKRLNSLSFFDTSTIPEQDEKYLGCYIKEGNSSYKLKPITDTVFCIFTSKDDESYFEILNDLTFLPSLLES